MLTLSEIARDPGVLADNARALRYYEKNGFRRFGSFTGPDGSRSLDMMLELPLAPDPSTPPT